MKPLSRARIIAILTVTASVIAAIAETPIRKLFEEDESRLRDPTPQFCLLTNGDLIYTTRHRGGTDIFRLDRRTSLTRKVASTTLYIDQSVITPDGRRMICSLLTSPGWPTGLASLDFWTGAWRVYGHVGDFDGCGDLAVSPDGTHAAFVHRGQVPGLSNARNAISEIDLALGRVQPVNQAERYYSVTAPVYNDNDHLIFSAERNLNNDGTTSIVMGEYGRGGDVHEINLPDDIRVFFCDYLPMQHIYCALVPSPRSPHGNTVTLIDQNKLDQPSTWRQIPLCTAFARYSASTDEVIFPSEDNHAYLIDSLSVKDSKTRTILAIRKQKTRE